MMRKTCKLEYYIREMLQDDKSEIIWLIDKDDERDFHIVNVRAITEFKKLKPVSGNSFEAFEYKNAYYFYTRVSLRFETIFCHINKLFIKNNVQPIFTDPSNLEECLEIRDDMLEVMSYNRANEFFGVNNHRDFRPPVYLPDIPNPNNPLDDGE